MTTAPRYYVTIRVVRQWLRAQRRPVPEDAEVPDEAAHEATAAILELAERARVVMGPDGRPKRTRSGALTLRVGSGSSRWDLVVSEAQRPEGPAAQIVAIRRGRQRGDGKSS